MLQLQTLITKPRICMRTLVAAGCTEIQALLAVANRVNSVGMRFCGMHERPNLMLSMNVIIHRHPSSHPTHSSTAKCFLPASPTAPADSCFRALRMQQQHHA